MISANARSIMSSLLLKLAYRAGRSSGGSSARRR